MDTASPTVDLCIRCNRPRNRVGAMCLNCKTEVRAHVVEHNAQIHAERAAEEAARREAAARGLRAAREMGA